MRFTCRSYSYQRRDLLNRIYASDEVRAHAIDRAEQLQSGLEADFPSFVKPMTQSHVTGGFWLVSAILELKRKIFRISNYWWIMSFFIESCNCGFSNIFFTGFANSLLQRSSSFPWWIYYFGGWEWRCNWNKIPCSEKWS